MLESLLCIIGVLVRTHGRENNFYISTGAAAELLPLVEVQQAAGISRFSAPCCFYLLLRCHIELPKPDRTAEGQGNYTLTNRSSEPRSHPQETNERVVRHP